MIGDYDAKEDVWEVGRTRQGLPVKMSRHGHGSICWLYIEVSDEYHKLITHMTPRRAFTFLARQGRRLASVR